ncbi:MAG: DNA mismatch repair endonuclease MutL, partial [Pseudomonadota bacterium]
MSERQDNNRRIARLSSAVADQIAAGEVVERPASVVKELMENALDAGARWLRIRIDGGGVKRIEVRDDGAGIHPDDLALAVSRHATSKIHSANDLDGIASLGFRGEALPSVASVSRLTLTSRSADDDTAWTVTADGAAPTEPRPAPHPPGTTVEVRDLFFNTPARRKFLRTEKTEFTHVEAVFRRLALSHFDVAFRLTHNRRVIAELPVAADRAAQERRLGDVCGRSFVDSALHIEHRAGELELEGWLALPTFSRSQADLQYFFLNGRMVRDKVVSHAIKLGYRDVLFHGRHPAYVLALRMNPARVDVNAHPAKTEVRFRDSREVHGFLHRTVESVLADTRPGAEASDAPGTAPTRLDAPPSQAPMPLRPTADAGALYSAFQAPGTEAGAAPAPPPA